MKSDLDTKTHYIKVEFTLINLFSSYQISQAKKKKKKPKLLLTSLWNLHLAIDIF